MVLPSFGEGSNLLFRRGASVLCYYTRLRVSPIVLFNLLSKRTNSTTSLNIQIFFKKAPNVLSHNSPILKFTHITHLPIFWNFLY